MGLGKLALLGGAVALTSAIISKHAGDDAPTLDDERDAFLRERVAELEATGIPGGAAAEIAANEWDKMVSE